LPLFCVSINLLLAAGSLLRRPAQVLSAISGLDGVGNAALCLFGIWLVDVVPPSTVHPPATSRTSGSGAR